ncbi:RNA-directed DNA polymerase from mobile element jockey [Trichonephila clavipes]|nr:RNA-directed DNA polymerase from mobile element jockey [Trichonephila clavipes]
MYKSFCYCYSSRNTQFIQRSDLLPRSDTFITDSEIEEELASQGVEAVKRITSTRDDVFDELRSKLQSYGHGTASCRGVATCNKCSSTEHANEACTIEWRKCANCKGEHAAYSKICPKWQLEKEIHRIKVLENLSYSEARERVVNILPPRASGSYANAVMTNTKSKKDISTQTDMGTQTEISHIETPTNIGNLTSESHKDSPIAQKPITNNLIKQETILSPP